MLLRGILDLALYGLKSHRGRPGSKTPWQWAVCDRQALTSPPTQSKQYVAYVPILLAHSKKGRTEAVWGVRQSHHKRSDVFSRERKDPDC